MLFWGWADTAAAVAKELVKNGTDVIAVDNNE